MTLNTAQKLPKVGDSQRIGRMAKRCFEANYPYAWIVDSTDGDGDYGFDFQIQVEDEGVVKDVFRLQLKGSESPSLSSDKKTFSISLSVSTVNYYARSTEPVLLVLADLSIDPTTPKNCPLYYQWIQDDIKRIQARTNIDNQDEVTFHIPTTNQLNNSTSLTNDIQRFRTLAKVGEQLDIVVESNHPALSNFERSEFVTKLAPSLAVRSPSLLDALTDDPITSWVEAPADSFQWYLNEATVALRGGDADSAQNAITSAEKTLEAANPLEQADYWHIVGRINCQLLDDEKAKIAFNQACKLSNDLPRHLIPWAEAELRLRFRLNQPNDFSDVIARLSSSDPSVIGMHARLAAAEWRYEDALKLVENLKDVNRYVVRSITYTMQSKFTESIAECEIGLVVPKLSDKTKLLFLILRARSEFALAIGEKYLNQIEIPMTGPAGTDISRLRSVWNDIASSISILRKLSWPANVELITDLWTNTATMLGLQSSTLPVMSEAAAARPSIGSLQEGLESLAAQVGKFDLALTANSRQPKSDTVTLRRISLLHLEGLHKECIDLMIAKENSISPDNSKFTSALSSAILSADKLVRPDLSEKWVKAISSIENYAPQVSLLNYYRTISLNILARDKALKDLEQQFEALNYPSEIGLQLFHDYDSSDALQAKKCVDLANQISSSMLLDEDSLIHLAQALATLGLWDKLLETSIYAASRFDDNDQFLAIKALALDSLGNTAEAHNLLQSLIEKSTPVPLALNTYISIASRSGFTVEALNSLERVLQKERSRDKQIYCLRHMFSLLHLSDPQNPRLLDIAWEIGKRSNPSLEVQEGLFLMTVFAATISEALSLSEERKKEFSIRIEAFFKNFPESNILKRVNFPDDISSDELFRIVKNIAGIDDEKIAWKKKLQTELRYGTTPVPYALRPKSILDWIPDLPSLWNVSKFSRWEDRQLHLTMVGADWNPIPSSKMKGRIPLLDFISLLVLSDLGILHLLFHIFPKIAIAKTTLLEIQQMLLPMTGTPYRSKLLDLQNILKDNFNSIEQPSLDITDGSKLEGQLRFEETLNLAQTNDYLLYSDDYIYRLYANSHSPNLLSICTLDLLFCLDEMNVLTPHQVAECIATLCEWRVDLVITPRYQMAILPNGLGATINIEEAVKILSSDKLFTSMFNGLWDPRKPYEELQGHAGALLKELVSNLNNRIESIVALMAIWARKASLHKNSPSPLIRVIALLIMQAAHSDQHTDNQTSTRLWRIYRDLVEYMHGNTMDDNKYQESIDLIAQVAAFIDLEFNLEDFKSMHNRLGKGLTLGTSDSDRFERSYAKESILLNNKKT